MLLFTFYLYRPDGSSIAFESFELNDDDQAFRQARKVLVEHVSAVQVEIWNGERLVGVLDPAARGIDAPALNPAAVRQGPVLQG